QHSRLEIRSCDTLRVPLPPPPGSSLPAVPDPESDLARAAYPTVSRLLATVVTYPSFESTATSALVAELVNFVATCCLDYATALVAESESASPPCVGGECAIGTDILQDRLEDFECVAAAVPRFASMLLAPEGDLDAPDIQTPRVKRPSGSPPAFKARYVARDFSQRQGVDYFLRVLLHVAAQRDYKLHSLDFSTQWSLRRPVYGLHQAPREWHDTLRNTLGALGFTPSTADPSLYALTRRCRCSTSSCTRDTPALTWVLQHFAFQFSSPQPTPLSTGQSLSAPPSNESVEPSGPYPELVGCLITSGMGLVLGGRGLVVLTGHADASWIDDSATQRSSQG
ncbi:unnamed protein product, partial [Closterium sp. NIES-53]